MANVERTPFTGIPNDRLKTLAEKRSMSPAAGASTVHPANERISHGDPGSSSGMGRQASPVHPPDMKFNVQNAKMPQPPAATKPGQGGIPVDLRDFTPMATGMAKKDSAKK